MPGLRLRGLLSHAGHGYGATSEDELRAIATHEAGVLTGLRDRAAAAGIAIDELSVGATPTLRFSATERGLTELRPGNYVYFDRTQVALGAARLSDCALTVLATVVSKPAADRIILDCGSKTLTSDQARGTKPTPGYGVVLTSDGAAIDSTLSIDRLSEEHATVRCPGIDAAGTWRPGAGAAQSFVRGVEPGRRDPAGGRRPRRGDLARSTRAGENHVRDCGGRSDASCDIAI